ncbi:GNAT family N-acetyltransferase [Streptomyces sp. NRRL B-1347]|uniref:GNAT family N-acetyltransferase n=1 Tax=Streptomyces sp. NRRL B-1347 TaxID=1476877 RepID=UPI00068A00DD|nr:GNAT family N-acetyltransferase [Streptomyces sp. NRRL B-1347]
MNTLHRLRLRAGFAWDYSPLPAVRAAHAAVETRVRPFHGVRSTAGPKAPSLAYAGLRRGTVLIQQQLEHQREELFPAPEPLREHHRVPRTRLLNGRWTPPGDLVAVVCSRAQAARLPRRAALVLPYRLHLVVDVGEGDGSWRYRTAKKERQWFSARRRTHAWRIDIATDDASFHDFYDHMHQPTLRARHRERARTEPRDRAYECLFRDGLLAFLTDAHGERLAGLLCHRDERRATLTMRLIGVRDGAPRLHALGAQRACVHLLLEWADTHGVRHVDFAGTEAWISKGSFQWKRKFRPRVTLPPNYSSEMRLWWHARRDTPAVRDFLTGHPLLEFDPDEPGALRAVYFHDEARPPLTGLPYRCANVSRSRTVHLDGFLQGTPQGGTPEDTAGGI